MARRALILIALIVLMPLTVSRLARAQEDRRAAAQVLFDEARKLANEGKYAEACPKFAESVRLERGVGSMLWLADCYESLGKTATAWAGFRDAAALAAIQHDPRGQIADQRAAALRPKLVTLTINVPADARIAGLEVKRDDFPVGGALWGEAVPVDPGAHTVSALAQHRKKWATTVDVAAGSHATAVEVPLLEIEPALPGPPPVPERAPVAPEPVVPVEPSAPPGRTQRILGLAAGGVGVIGLGVGALLALKARSSYDASNADGHCQTNNHCDVPGLSDRNDAYSFATGATVALIAGGVLAAAGVVLYLTAPRASSPATTGRLQVVPALTLRGGSVALAGSF